MRLELWQSRTCQRRPVAPATCTAAAYGTGVRPDTAAAVIGSVGTSSAVMALRQKREVVRTGHCGRSPQVTADSVHVARSRQLMPVSPTTVDLQPGTCVVRRSELELGSAAPDIDTAARRWPSDPQGAGRRAWSPGVTGRGSVPRTDIVAKGGSASSVFGRVGPRALPRRPRNPGTAAIGSGWVTPLVAYSPSSEPADPAPPSEVYDCNNYEPARPRN